MAIEINAFRIDEIGIGIASIRINHFQHKVASQNDSRFRSEDLELIQISMVELVDFGVGAAIIVKGFRQQGQGRHAQIVGDQDVLGHAKLALVRAVQVLVRQGGGREQVGVSGAGWVQRIVDQDGSAQAVGVQPGQQGGVGGVGGRQRLKEHAWGG